MQGSPCFTPTGSKGRSPKAALIPAVSPPRPVVADSLSTLDTSPVPAAHQAAMDVDDVVQIEAVADSPKKTKPAKRKAAHATEPAHNENEDEEEFSPIDLTAQQGTVEPLAPDVTTSEPKVAAPSPKAKPAAEPKSKPKTKTTPKRSKDTNEHTDTTEEPTKESAANSHEKQVKPTTKRSPAKEGLLVHTWELNVTRSGAVKQAAEATESSKNAVETPVVVPPGKRPLFPDTSAHPTQPSHPPPKRRLQHRPSLPKRLLR